MRPVIPGQPNTQGCAQYPQKQEGERKGGAWRFWPSCPERQIERGGEADQQQRCEVPRTPADGLARFRSNRTFGFLVLAGLVLGRIEIA